MEDEENEDVLSAVDLVYLQQNKIKNGDASCKNGESPSGFNKRKTLECSGSECEKEEVSTIS